MLSVRTMTVHFADLPALDGVDLDVAPGRILVVLGPSGCGKSTLLRAIAGLEPAARGTVRWGDADLTATPVHRRRFGMMFQDHALFWHLDVAANIGYGLRMAGAGREARDLRVAELLELVGLRDFAHRRVDELSGGEAQRVALARALAPKPRVLLLDEPLSSVDRDRRDRLVADLQTIVRTTSTAAIVVTHDHDEALALADTLLVMRAGRSVQVGDPATVWQRPATPFVAGFLGANVVPAGAIALPGSGLVAVHPDSIRIAEDGPLSGTVVNRAFQRDHVQVTVTLDTGSDVVIWHRFDPAGGSQDPIGTAVRLRIDSFTAFDPGSEAP